MRSARPKRAQFGAVAGDFARAPLYMMLASGRTLRPDADEVHEYG